MCFPTFARGGGTTFQGGRRGQWRRVGSSVAEKGDSALHRIRPRPDEKGVQKSSVQVPQRSVLALLQRRCVQRLPAVH